MAKNKFLDTTGLSYFWSKIKPLLDAKVPTSRKVNEKELSDDITLTAEDVGAIASTSAGVAGGVATLNEDGKIPTEQIPDELSGNAVDITYDNTTSGLTATDIQAAIDELANEPGVPEGVTYVDGENPEDVELAMVDADTLGGQLPEYYATAQGLEDLKEIVEAGGGGGTAELPDGIIYMDLESAGESIDKIYNDADSLGGESAEEWQKKIDDVVDGTTVVGEATKATFDGDGNNISETYLNKNTGGDINANIVAKTTTSDPRLFKVHNALHQGSVMTDGVGNLGIYSDTLSKWIIRASENTGTLIDGDNVPLHSANYFDYALPKTGGDVYNGQTSHPMAVKGSGSPSYLDYKNGQGDMLGAIGFYEANRPVCVTPDYSNTFALIHENNIRSYTAGSADYLNAQHGNEINFHGLTGDNGMFFNYRNGDIDDFDTDPIDYYGFCNMVNSATDQIRLNLYEGSGIRSILHTGNMSDHVMTKGGGTFTGAVGFEQNIQVNGGATITGPSPHPMALKNTLTSESCYINFNSTDGLLGYAGFYDNMFGIMFPDAFFKRVFHEGNKPIGGYTGNGDVAERTINVGGIGKLIYIYDTMYLTSAIIGYSGGIAWDYEGKNLRVVPRTQARFVDGNLILNTTDAAINNAGTGHSYEVL